jgi:WD40 repeat protein
MKALFTALSCRQTINLLQAVTSGRIVIREMKEDGQMKHAIETVRGDVNSICFSPDGTKLASGHDDKMIRVFDVENGDLILGPIEGHTRKCQLCCLVTRRKPALHGVWDRSIRVGLRNWRSNRRSMDGSHRLRQHHFPFP